MICMPHMGLEWEAIEVCCWQQNFCPELYLRNTRSMVVSERPMWRMPRLVLEAFRTSSSFAYLSVVLGSLRRVSY